VVVVAVGKRMAFRHHHRHTFQLHPYLHKNSVSLADDSTQ